MQKIVIGLMYCFSNVIWTGFSDGMDVSRLHDSAHLLITGSRESHCGTEHDFRISSAAKTLKRHSEMIFLKFVPTIM